MSTILIADDDAPFRAVLRDILEPRGHRIVEATDGRDAMVRLGRMRVDLLIADQQMPRMTGMELLRAVRDTAAPPPVIMLTAFGTVRHAVDAVHAGATDYLTKPLESPQALIDAVERVLAPEAEEIVGESPRIRELIETADRVAGKDVPVLITGESGTGKELFARRIHQRSPRAKKPLVAVNCAALPDTLAESELFGYERGAFTGAERPRAGRFEEASGGTLFLDEVGELSPAVQAKLLRAIEERVVRRLGATRDIPVDIRIVAATNRDLRTSDFRSDLYFRLAVVTLDIPPLRERPDDIAPIARDLLARLAQRHGFRRPSLTADAVEAMRAHTWPGNVRELRNAIERALVLRGEEPIRAHDLGLQPPEPALSASVGDVERERILEALRQTHGNRDAAARLLGVSVRTLYYRLSRYGLT
jgi:DNA-binding NtrC family response regulator